MIELPLIFLGGLLGSAHCVGMCGGFALLVGAPAPRWSTNLVRQLAFSAGRVFTYTSCGALLGFAGLRLAEDLPAVINLQAMLAIVAGVLLVAQGLWSAGVRPAALRPSTWLARRQLAPFSTAGFAGSALHFGCGGAGMLGSLLRASRLRDVFLSGLFVGFMPCGLVYAYLALATSTGNLAYGAATMTAFGLGTMPLMILTGSGASVVSLATRQRLLRLAAWCVIVTGLISIARGCGFLDLGGAAPSSGCPFCQ